MMYVYPGLAPCYARLSFVLFNIRSLLCYTGWIFQFKVADLTSFLTCFFMNQMCLFELREESDC